MYTNVHSYFIENMSKSEDAARVRLYEIFVAAGLTSRTKTIAEVAALGGIAEDEPVIRTYRTVNLQYDEESQSMRESSTVAAGGRATDKKTLVIQL